MSKQERLERDPIGKRVINKTDLAIDKAASRGIVHRDYLAHTLRFSFVLKLAQKLRNRENFSVLDVGCGSEIQLLRVLYTNKICPKYYLSLDCRDLSIADSGITPNFDAEFRRMDFIDPLPKCKYGKWDIISFTEVIEHGSKESGIKILENIRNIMSPETYLFISTPNFNGESAANHVYEYQFDELNEILNHFFTIEAMYGTFASQREICPVLDEHEMTVFERLKEYYDSNVLSVIFAPNHPRESRNSLRVCRLKQ